MDGVFLAVGMAGLWTVAVIVVLALMGGTDDEDEQDAKQLADELEGKGQS